MTAPALAGQLEPDQALRRVAAEARAVTPEPPAPVGEDPDERVMLDRISDAADELATKGEDPLELAKMTADDLVDLVELVFSFAALGRGAHWELAQAEGDRMRKWFQKVVDRHGAAKAAKWLPDVIAVGLLVYAFSKRVKEDKRLAQLAAGPDTPGTEVV